MYDASSIMSACAQEKFQIDVARDKAIESSATALSAINQKIDDEKALRLAADEENARISKKSYKLCVFAAIVSALTLIATIAFGVLSILR